MRYQQTRRKAGDLQLSQAGCQPGIYDQTPIKTLDIKYKLSWLALLHAYYHCFLEKLGLPTKLLLGEDDWNLKADRPWTLPHLPLLLADLILYLCHKP